MTPALWGLMTALGWGGADFIARFTGRAMGHGRALLAVLLVGSLAMPLVFWFSGAPLVTDLSALWLLGLAALGVTLATFLLYWALARGPVSIVSPIAASYPALNVIFAFALGVRPGLLQWAAFVVVIAGVVLVARAAGSFQNETDHTPTALRRTIAIALATSLCFAVAVAAIQAAAAVYGELQTVLVSRWVGLAAVAGCLALGRRPMALPLRLWPLIVLQGLLDASAYVTLVVVNQGEGGVIAIVVGSTFSAITVILARIFLREAMTRGQWLGLALVICGVAALASQG